MSDPSDMRLSELAPPPPQALMPPTEDVTALPHAMSKSPSSTPPPKQRKHSAESNPAPWPLPDPPPRAVERSTATSDVSQIDPDDVAIQSANSTGDSVVSASHEREQWIETRSTPSESEEIAVAEQSFIDNDTPSSTASYRKKITTTSHVVKKFTKKPASLRASRPPLPAQPGESSGSGSAVQRWTANVPQSQSSQMYVDTELLQGMQERIRALESENQRVTELLASREQGWFTTAAQHQKVHHDSVDNLTAQLAQQSAVANSRIASAENAIQSQKQMAADEIGSVRVQARVQMEAMQQEHQRHVEKLQQ